MPYLRRVRRVLERSRPVANQHRASLRLERQRSAICHPWRGRWRATRDRALGG
jgi:hypothetical protein